MIFVRVVFLGGVVGTVHVAVMCRAFRRVEFRHPTKVLHTDSFDAPWVLILHYFTPAPSFLNAHVMGASIVIAFP
jgi:hypothetical protein